MLKKASIVAALVMALSSGVLAAGDNSIEQTWKQQIPTAHLQYEQGHGNVATWVGMDRSMNEQWNATSEKLDNVGMSFGYGLMKNMEVRGYIAGERYENVVNGAGKNLAYMGSVKGQMYNANGLMISARGAVSHNSMNGTSLDLDAYSNKILNQKVTLYNNAGVTINDGNVTGSLTNGMQYLVSNRNAVKVAVDTVYNSQSGQVTPYVSAALKTKVSPKMTNLLQATATTGAMTLHENVEANLTPDFLLKGHADMTVSNAVNNRVSGNMGVDAEKQLGMVTVKAGVAHNLKANDWRIATVKAGVDVDVTKDLELSIEGAASKYYYPEQEGKHNTSVKMALNYEL